MKRIISKKPTVVEMGSGIVAVDPGYVIPDVFSIRPTECEHRVYLYFINKPQPWVVVNADWDYDCYSELGDS